MPMKNCHTCQQTYSDTIDFCPRDGGQLTAQATETEAQIAAGLSRRFRIVRRLGEGGMGAVFLAEQVAVGNCPVALKVLYVAASLPRHVPDGTWPRHMAA